MRGRRPRRTRPGALLESEGETVHRIGRVAAADAPDAPVEFVRVNVGVLASGSGTNLQALLDAARRAASWGRRASWWWAPTCPAAGR